MSSWIYVLTNKGRQLQAKAQTGVELKYTRMAVGSGTLAGQALAAMTALITPVKSLPIIRLKHPPGATRALIGATLTNADVQTGFYFREIGIYATDPDDGEILYMYANAGSTADYIAPIGDGVIEKDVNMNVIVGSASNVTAVINESLVYVTHDELEEALENIEVDVPDASLTVKGKTLLSNATDSTLEDRAATPKAVNDARLAAQKYVDDKTWQKYSLTDESGSVTNLSGAVDLNALTNTGFYFISGFTNGPNTTGGAYYVEVFTRSVKRSSWTLQRMTQANFTGKQDTFQRVKLNTLWNPWTSQTPEEDLWGAL